MIEHPYEQTTAWAAFRRAPVYGNMYFRQIKDDPFAETSVSVELANYVSFNFLIFCLLPFFLVSLSDKLRFFFLTS